MNSQPTSLRQSAALEASTKRAYPRPCGHKWWNQECARVVRTLHRVVRDPTSTTEDIREAKHTLRRVVRHSKRHICHTRIDEFKEPKDIFNAVKWNRTEGSLPICPLKEGDRMHNSTDDKASYLVHALLQKAVTDQATSASRDDAGSQGRIIGYAQRDDQ